MAPNFPKRFRCFLEAEKVTAMEMPSINWKENLKKMLNQEVDREVRDGYGSRAAVSIILREKDGLQVLLIKRKKVPSDPWSGHVALPGGMFEATDKNLKKTVVREVCEEIGVNLNLKGEILGSLDETHPLNAPGLKVTPFVVCLNGKVNIKAMDEIEKWFWVPMEFFLKKIVRVPIGKFGVQEAVIYRKQVIWGMTLRILKEISYMLRKAGAI